MLLLLCGLIAVLALVAAGGGLLWQGGEGAVAVETLRGETATLYGRGLYRYDTLFAGAGARGTDALTVFLGIPLLLAAAWAYGRGSRRGALLLTGTLGYFLYVYAGYALGTVAYNELFLVYVALFSASLWAFVLAFASVDRAVLAAARLPRRGPGAFMIASGLLTLVVWLGPLVTALAEGRAPARLGPYTTGVTDALDLAIITPAALAAGVLILRRAPLGYLMALSLLVLEVMLAPMIAAQTASQVSAGVSFSPAEIVGPMIGFATLGVLAIWVLFAILRPISAPPSSRPVDPSPAVAAGPSLEAS